MACRARRRPSYGPPSYHPYSTAQLIRQAVKADLQNKAPQTPPEFADIPFEILAQEAAIAGSACASWLIRETRDAYAFLLRKRGLCAEYTHVIFESVQDNRANGAQWAPAYNILTVMYYSKVPHYGVDSPCAEQEAHQFLLADSEQRTDAVSVVNFGRRFRLPNDSLPEQATATLVEEEVTVIVPRQTGRKHLHLAHNKTDPLEGHKLTEVTSLPCWSNLSGATRVDTQGTLYHKGKPLQIRYISRKTANIESWPDSEQMELEM